MSTDPYSNQTATKFSPPTNGVQTMSASRARPFREGSAIGLQRNHSRGASMNSRQSMASRQGVG